MQYALNEAVLWQAITKILRKGIPHGQRKAIAKKADLEFGTLNTMLSPTATRAIGLPKMIILLKQLPVEQQEEFVSWLAGIFDKMLCPMLNGESATGEVSKALANCMLGFAKVTEAVKPALDGGKITSAEFTKLKKEAENNQHQLLVLVREAKAKVSDA